MKKSDGTRDSSSPEGNALVSGRHQTYDEIVTQTDAWADSLRAVADRSASIDSLWKEGFDRVLYTGCGSTYYLSVSASALLRNLDHVDAAAFPASEFLLYPQLVYSRPVNRTLLIACSRSGKTTETLRAVEAFRTEERGEVLVVTTDLGSPLVDLGDLVIAIPEAQETGIAQTKSFASMYLATVGIATLMAERYDLWDQLEDLIPIGKRLVNDYEDLAERLAREDINRFYYLGSGPRYGLACEACLKLQEISLTGSAAYHFLEFRHGPMSMVDEKTAVVGLLSEVSRSYEMDVLEDMRALGGQILSVGESKADVSFDSGLPEPIRGVLYLPVLQLLAYYCAMLRGLDPDVLNNLESFIDLDLPPAR